MRVDPMGSGAFGSSRGHREHEGVDFMCIAGQPVIAPMAGRITRKLRVYAKDARYQGLVLRREHVLIKLFYVEPDEALIGAGVEEGQVIGTAQNIADKYGTGMHPHVHMEVIVDALEVIRFLGREKREVLS